MAKITSKSSTRKSKSAMCRRHVSITRSSFFAGIMIENRMALYLCALRVTSIFAWVVVTTDAPPLRRSSAS